MSALVEITSLVIADELDVAMKRSAARLAKLAALQGDDVQEAGLLGAVSALRKYVPALADTAEAVAEGMGGLKPSSDAPPATAAAVLAAELDRCAAGAPGAMESAAAWARALAGRDGLDAPAALALARFAALAGDEASAEAAAKAVAGISDADAIASTLCKARAAALLGTEESVSAARAVFESVEQDVLGPGGSLSSGSDPLAQAHWIALSGELYAADQHVRYLDAVERAVLNQVPFEMTDDGGGVLGRTLGGDIGRVDDATATPAVAQSLARAAGSVLFVDKDGALVSSQPSNAVAEIEIGGRARLRCLASTQLPTRGWSSWEFEPNVVTGGTEPSVSTTRRTGRRQRAAMRTFETATAPKAAPPVTFTFRVRVPTWAAGAKIPPFVKVDGERASVKRSQGFLSFDVNTGRATKIEVTFSITANIIEGQSAASWAREVALCYGPLVMTANAQYNPTEDLGLPMRVTSSLEEIELVADIRRRLPVLQAMVLGGGGRPNRVLFSPLSDVGGFTSGIGGAQPVQCPPFRTWHRWGR
jgi:hypothetical protein